MSIFLWFIYLFLGVVILGPLFQGDLFKVNNRYHNFRYVSYVLLLWWLIDFFRLVSEDSYTIYFLSLLIFPVVMLFTITLYLAISKVFNKQIKPLVLILLWLIFIANLILSLTNHIHQLLVILPISDNISLEIFINAPLGIFFYIHTLISYALLIVIIYRIIGRLINRLKHRSDLFPLIFISVAIIIGIILNIIHIFVNTFTIDPTLITIIVFLTTLYYVFYIRDLKLILGLNRNRFILDHLREKYLIVNEAGFIVDASKEFINSFDVDINFDVHYQELLEIIEKKAVLFKESHEITGDFKEDIMYFNFLEKPIHLPFFKKSGTFYLFFDQTANLKYINDMNYVKTHDLMTKVYNRNFLEDIRNKLDDELVNYHIVLLDLDGLKLFNDYLGHDKGDDLLMRFASELKQICKDENTYVIRLGGDEFLILAIEKNQSFIDSVLEKLKLINSDKSFLESFQFSYAISASSKELNTMKKVLEEADRLMYTMKQSKLNYKRELKRVLKEYRKR